MSIGLFALLDDIAALAKAAAASIDDVAAQTARAGIKAAGVVIDDAAVTPGYVVGLSPARELPIIARIAIGSLRNKLLFLLPAAMMLSLLAPWAVTPLLMLGGAYLCYEGAEKVSKAFLPAAIPLDRSQPAPAQDAQTYEDRKVASAIKTDFILSAEIMAITLAAVPQSALFVQALVLALVGIGITAAVYGAVALIVKADDVGLALAAPIPRTQLDHMKRAIGRSLVRGMPILLQLLSIVGTAAMIWVGGGIIVHGLEAYDWPALGRIIHGFAETAKISLPPIGAIIGWAVEAAGSGLIGLLIGAMILALNAFIARPLLKFVSSRGVD